MQRDDDTYDDDGYFQKLDCAQYEGWQLGYFLCVALYSIGTLLSLQNKLWNDSTLGAAEIDQIVQVCKNFTGDCEVQTGMFVEFDEVEQKVEFRSISGDGSYDKTQSGCDIYACLER